ncbi:MAG: hypothetical protein H6643_02965 [Caldilineaceae bacterium]|nr:hypothetical protein [Caldilineaceae bacterium]
MAPRAFTLRSKHGGITRIAWCSTSSKLAMAARRRHQRRRADRPVQWWRERRRHGEGDLVAGASITVLVEVAASAPAQQADIDASGLQPTGRRSQTYTDR